MGSVNEKAIQNTLTGNGGEDFRRAMNRLISAMARSAGLNETQMRFQALGNIGDAGVDAETLVAGTRDTIGYLTGPTVWQFKASRDSPTVPAFEREANKPGVVKRLSTGATFCFASLAEMPPETLQ